MEYMDTVMSQLSEIESAAVAISDNASLRKKEIAKEYEEKIRVLDATMDAQTEEKLDQLRQELAEKAAKELADMKTSTEEYMKNLEQNYQQHHTEMAEKILKKMIGE